MDLFARAKDIRRRRRGAGAGQALAELALVLPLILLMAAGLVAIYQAHRAAAAAHTAAYACATYISQSRNPDQAAVMGWAAAWTTLNAFGWSGTGDASFSVAVSSADPGEEAVCRVTVHVPWLFGGGVLGLPPFTYTAEARTVVENWKARWP